MANSEGGLSRRNLLVGLAASGATVGTVIAQNSGPAGVATFKQAIWQQRPGRRDVPLGTANLDDWAQLVGSTFRTTEGHVLELADVRAFPQPGPHPSGVRDRAFVAGFEIMSGGPMADSRIYRVDHPQGAFEVFLTTAEKPMRMLAVFG